MGWIGRLRAELFGWALEIGCSDAARLNRNARLISSGSNEPPEEGDATILELAPGKLSIACPFSLKNLREFPKMPAHGLARGAKQVEPVTLNGRCADGLGFAEIGIAPEQGRWSESPSCAKCQLSCFPEMERKLAALERAPALPG